MYALSVVLGALAVVVTCASAVVAARMVRSRDARVSDLLYRIAYLQDEADFDVRMMQHYQELYADSQDWAVDLKRQLEAKTEDHDVLLASYEALHVDYQRLQGQLNSFMFDETAAQELRRLQDSAYAAQAELLAARRANAELRHELESFINGSWSRDDSPEDVATCDCVQGSPLCDSCDPWGVTL